MSLVPRALLLSVTVVLPVLVLQGTRFGFELPKAHLATLALAALFVLCIPRIPDLWRRSSTTARVSITAAAILAGMVTASALSSDARGMSLFGPEARFLGALVVLGTIGLVVVVPAIVTDWRTLEHTLWALSSVLLLTGLIAVSQQFGWDLTPWPSGPPGGVLGTLGNSNFVGMFGALGAPVAIALWLSRPAWRLAAAALAVLTLTTVVFAGSSLGGLAALVGAATAALALLPRRFPGARGLLVAAAPVGGVLVGLSVVLVGNLAGQTSAIARWRLWQSPFGMIMDRPVTGVGWARLRAHYLAYRLPETVMLVPGGDEQRADSSHAWTIDLAANAGLIALLAMVVLLVSAGLLLRHVWQTCSDRERPLVAGVSGLLAAHGVGSSLAVPSIVGVFAGFLLLGLAISLGTVQDRPPRSGRDSRRSFNASRSDVLAGVGALLVTATLAFSLVGFHRGAVETSIAVAQSGSGDLERSSVTAQRAIDHTPWWSETWMVLARIEDDRSNPDSVIRALRGANDADNRHFDATLSLAQTYLAIDDQEQAGYWFDRAVYLDPYGFRANSRRAAWALSVGRPDIARESMDAIELWNEPGGPGWSTYQEILEAYEVVTG